MKFDFILKENLTSCITSQSTVGKFKPNRTYKMV